MNCDRHEGLAYLETFITKPDLPVYAIVRNPYTHLCSYFFHCLKHGKYVLDNVLTLKQNFENFAKTNVNDTRLRQCDYIKSNNGINVKIFKFEESNFIDYLNQTHGLNLDKFTRSNENNHPLYNKSPKAIINLFSQLVVELVQKHRYREFEMFGYSTDILKLS